ncbi:hypothetical protein ACJMK2_002515 [Sinanodonta woodiana]|uniref:HECT domain-containing protein n=1 Tax=Sinanodonta woodiana TaxID=1069815 RepID=A0ABD3XVH2_SINWO
MEEFLRHRKISEDIITRMKEDGIDVTVISMMDVEQLQKYLPRYGDCLATIAYAKQQRTLEDTASSCSDRKRSLRDRLLEKLRAAGNRTEHFRRAVPQAGNINAKKILRKVEIGWLNTYGINGQKQVRSTYGGGTRAVQVHIDATVSDILSTGKELFFPSGISKKGKVDDFDFYLADQTGEKLSDQLTLKDIYESTKLKTLRLYVVTTAHTRYLNGNNSKERNNTEPDISAQLIHPNQSDLVQKYPQVQAEDNIRAISSVSTTELQIPYSNQAEHIMGLEESKTSFNNTYHGDCFEKNSIHYFGSNDNLPSISPNHDVCDLTLDSHEFLMTAGHSQEQFQPAIDLSQALDDISVKTILLHRSNLQEEMLQYFKASDILNTTLKFKFVNECGHDADDGVVYHIPVLSQDYGQEEWEAVGRILIKGYKEHKYYPISLAPAFFIAVVHGENSVTPQLLKDSFLLYISQSEKDVIEAVERGTQDDQNELLFLLDRFQCHKIPEQSDMASIIVQIAHKVLIQESKYALDTISGVGEGVWQIDFPDTESILTLYGRLDPTIPKVIELLCASPRTKEENASIGFLHRFIRGRNKLQLRKLLRFLTGSDVICVDKIDIQFIVRHGKGRLPSIHTCGPMLELPSTYANYPDFRSEWESMLDSKECMEMNIV